MITIRLWLQLLIIHGKIHNLMALLENCERWQIQETCSFGPQSAMAFPFALLPVYPKVGIITCSLLWSCLTAQDTWGQQTVEKSLEPLTTTNSSSFSCLSDILHSHKRTNKNTKVHQSFKSRNSWNPVIKMLSKARKQFLPIMSTWNRNRKRSPKSHALYKAWRSIKYGNSTLALINVCCTRVNLKCFSQL